MEYPWSVCNHCCMCCCLLSCLHLQELSVTTELIITATFDTLRWIVRLLTLTRRHQPPAAASARQRRLAAAAAAAEAADAHLTPGSNGSRGGSRRGSNGSSSGSRSRPGSPAAASAAAGAARPSPFASPGTAAAAAAAAAGGRDGGDESDGGPGFGAFYRTMSPQIDFGQEPDTQACVHQQQQQPRQYSSGMLSPQSTVESFYSGASGSSSSSGSDTSDNDPGHEETWRVGSRASGAPSLLRSKSEGADLAGFRKHTKPGATALPRLTLRRVRSVSRWNHHSAAGSSGGGWQDGSNAAAAAADDWDGSSELTAAAQCIMSAGGCDRKGGIHVWGWVGPGRRVEVGGRGVM